MAIAPLNQPHFARINPHIAHKKRGCCSSDENIDKNLSFLKVRWKFRHIDSFGIVSKLPPNGHNTQRPTKRVPPTLTCPSSRSPTQSRSLRKKALSSWRSRGISDLSATRSPACPPWLRHEFIVGLVLLPRSFMMICTRCRKWFCLQIILPINPPQRT